GTTKQKINKPLCGLLTCLLYYTFPKTASTMGGYKAATIQGRSPRNRDRVPMWDIIKSAPEVSTTIRGALYYVPWEPCPRSRAYNGQIGPTLLTDWNLNPIENNHNNHGKIIYTPVKYFCVYHEVLLATIENG
ncbi:hypothetical protein, partial [Clostridioides difficile]